MMSNTQKAFNLAIQTGELLLKNGAEIFRVQETIILILEAYEIWDYHVFVISNGIFATVNEEKEDFFSCVRHVPLGSVNLGKIAAINQISREICQGSCSMEEARLRLQKCSEKEKKNRLFLMAACGMGSASFCYLFGGKAMDCGVAFFLGILLEAFLLRAEKNDMSKFISSIIGSFLVTFLGTAISRKIPFIGFNSLVIGAIIPLVPGVGFTTSIREFFNKDYLSGSIHLIDAVLTAVCIAVGVGAGISLYQWMAGGIKVG